MTYEKGSVENAIGHTQATALKGRRFETIEEQNAFLEHWETRWAAQRIHGSHKKQVEAMFQQERPHLKPLPVMGMQYFKEQQRSVCDDGCIRVAQSSYAARPAMIGDRVMVRLFEHHLEIRDLKTQALLRTHALVERPGSVVLPDEERIFNPSRETRAILRQAQAIGPAAHALCETLFRQEGRVGQRKLWGIVRLAKNQPRRFVEQACEMAMRDGIRSYKIIKALVEQLVSEALALLDTPVQNELQLTQDHPLIRGAEEYADLFALAAQHHANPSPTHKDPS